MTRNDDTAGTLGPAALDRLAAHAEQIAGLDAREARHFEEITARLAEIADAVRDLAGAAGEQDPLAGAIARLAARVDAIDARLPGTDADTSGGADDGDGGGKPYRPVPPPRWWKLTGAERDEAVARLRGWADQVLRPGYGQITAGIGTCWDQHPLCLYALDIAAELWSVLYLTPTRTPAVISAQAEFQARILPALAEQMTAETSRCPHARPRPSVLANGHAGRTA